MKFRYSVSPLAACGCYVAILVGNLGILAGIVFAAVKIAHLAWFGK